MKYFLNVGSIYLWLNTLKILVAISQKTITHIKRNPILYLWGNKM